MCAVIPVKSSLFSSCCIGMPCILSLNYCVRWSLRTRIKQGARQTDINACDWEMESGHAVNSTYSTVQ